MFIKNLLLHYKKSGTPFPFRRCVLKFSVLLFLLVGLLGSCSESRKNNQHVISVESHASSNSLFYSGIISPLKTMVVPSPVDGVIVDMPFQYGQEIKADQLLFQISSAKFISDYKMALMQYIKAKSDFNAAKTLLNEAKFLHKNQLISDDDFRMKQSSYYASQLTLLQATDTMEILLHQLNIKNINPYELTIADAEKINKALHLQMKADNLSVFSPANGVVLSYGKNESDNKKISKGDAVKQGEVLAIIGDMSGINVRIKVNELTVNQLQPGQKVKVTGIAFPDETLVGEIKRVDRQGETAGSGFPNFNVEVEVMSLTEIQQKIIHAGMSAKVEIDLEQADKIMVPMSAVHEKNGESFVNALNEKTGKVQEVAIRTGKTTMDAVYVVSGLKEGEKIVLPD